MLTLLLQLLVFLIGGLISGVIFRFIGSLLYDNYKRPIPKYGLKFEKRIEYTHPGYRIGNNPLMITGPTTEYIENYISVGNYGDISIWNLSVRPYFSNQKEKLEYSSIGLSNKLLDLNIEFLSEPLPVSNLLPELFQTRDEVIRKKTETGLFIDATDMKKLNQIKFVKIKVEYEWERKKNFDIWLVDFSDENWVEFFRIKRTLWQSVSIFYKRIL